MSVTDSAAVSDTAILMQMQAVDLAALFCTPAREAYEVWMPGDPSVWGSSVPRIDVCHWLMRLPVHCLRLQGRLLRCPIQPDACTEGLC